MRKVLLALSLAVCLSVVAQTDSLPHRKRVAVVLSGGGAKGVAHVGVLKVLEQMGIPVDIVTGTSMGSIVGGLYAIGYSANDLDSIVRVQDWSLLLSDRPDKNLVGLSERRKQDTYLLVKPVDLSNKSQSISGFIQGINLDRLFNHLTSCYPDSMDFGQLPRPFACVATNIVDNSEVDIFSGRVAEAMRTSMAIPGAFTPIVRDSMVLVDGGLCNNYPVDLARKLGADIVIGVTLQSDGKKADELQTASGVLGQIVDINCKNKFDENLADTDIPIRVNCEGYGTLSFSPAAVDSLILRGESAALQCKDDLEKLAAELRGYPKTGNLMTCKPAPLTDDLTDFYQNDSRKIAFFYLGARFDTEEMAALQGNVSYSLNTRFPTSLEVTARLGHRFMGRADFNLGYRQGVKSGLSYTFRHNDTDIYYEGSRDHSTVYNEHKVDLNLISLDISKFQVALNAAWDYYHFVDVLTSGSSVNLLDKARHQHYYRYRLSFCYDSEDNPFFTTRGGQFMGGYGFYTDNLGDWKDHIGLSIVDAVWRKTFTFGKVFSLQPMFCGRSIFGANTTSILMNFIGGTSFGRYFEQQMPFAGVGNVEPIKNVFASLSLKSQLRLTENNYAMVRVSAGQHSDKFDEIFNNKMLFGVEADYYYRTILGPVGGSLGWSNRTKCLNVYVNLGFEF